LFTAGDSDAQHLRRDDTAKDAPARNAQGPRGLDVALRDGGERTTNDLGGIGARYRADGDDGDDECIAALREPGITESRRHPW
jgi:hypothetical protein